MKHYKAIIFDIDGTLLNTVDQNMYPLIRIIKEELDEDWTYEQVVPFTANPGMRTLQILGIKDLRSDKRIDFVGGLRGLEELKRRVDSGEMRMALALYPVSMQQIINIADSGNIMPPKATWFEPKLRSGLVVHKLS